MTQPSLTDQADEVDLQSKDAGDRKADDVKRPACEVRKPLDPNWLPLGDVVNGVLRGIGVKRP